MIKTKAFHRVDSLSQQRANAKRIRPLSSSRQPTGVFLQTGAAHLWVCGLILLGLVFPVRGQSAPEEMDEGYQDAPAIEINAPIDPRPGLLSAEQYLVPGVGPRPYADYAPIGFYPLDYQEAPGAPPFEPILPPVSLPEEDGGILADGILPGSFLLPRTNTSFRLSGFVRLGSTFDFDPIGTRDQFVTNTIPVPQEEGGRNVNFSARPTRLSLDSWTPTTIRDWNVHTFLQFDFFSGNPPGVGSSSTPRLRFAYVDFGYFRFGQDTSVFMDPGSFPFTADFAGPRGLINLRQGLARITLPLAEEWYWAAAVEQPFSDISANGLGENIQDVPDLTTHFRYEADRGHLQVSSIVRTIGYEPLSKETTHEVGWGMNFSTNFHPWAILTGAILFARKILPAGFEAVLDCNVLSAAALAGISRT